MLFRSRVWIFGVIGKASDMFAGFVFATIASLVRSLGIKSFFALNAATLSHWLLDVVVHRNDMTLTPSPFSDRYGLGLFDHSRALFAVDLCIIGSSMIYYAAATKPADWNLMGKRLLMFGALFAAMQVAFLFVEMPGKQARWVHTPLMLAQILGVVGAIGAVERIGDRNLANAIAKEKAVDLSFSDKEAEVDYDKKRREADWEDEVPQEI